MAGDMVLRGVLIAMVLALPGCMLTGNKEPESPEVVSLNDLPPMRWSGRPEAKSWTETAMKAMTTHGAALPATTPRDIDTWCPAYPENSEAEKRMFWTGLLSTLAKHESTYNPRAVGGGGLWFGLVQIAPPTARGYGCAAKSGAALKDGNANLSCAIRILAHTVPRDQVVSEGWRGVAADWGPFHSARKREDMIAWTRAQPYCQAKPEPKGPLGLLKGLAPKSKG